MFINDQIQQLDFNMPFGVALTYDALCLFEGEERDIVCMYCGA